MSQNFGIELGSALQYLEDKVRAVVGYDHASIAFRSLLDKHLALAVRDATQVQIIGMYQPVSIFEVYQPTRLIPRFPVRVKTVADLLERNNDAVVFGGPGRGKTILMHYIFATSAKRNEHLPLLFTLRWPGSTEDLTAFVEHLSKDKTVDRQSVPLLLLVDGYDEISVDDRRVVSTALRSFAALKRGMFLLTCRTFYNVDDLKAEYYDVDRFSHQDSIGFIEAFARAYGATIDPRALLEDLDRHGFSDFANHPLMLAMICILKSGPMPELPQTPIRLIRRALDTLTLRWDDAKGVRRDSRLNLDGDDRVRCMMSVAYAMKRLIETSNVIEYVVVAFLKLLQRLDVSPTALLMEIAQWYGILVPVSDSEWTFVHRTIHDYMAARHWVESGAYSPLKVTQWNARAAYAACLVPNATRSIVTMLEKSDDIAPFVECLYNRALFDVDAVAAAVEMHLGRVRNAVRHNLKPGVTYVHTNRDFFQYATDELLFGFLQLAAESRNPVRDVLAGYSLLELSTRGTRISAALLRRLTELFKHTKFEIARGSSNVCVSITQFEV